MKAKDFRNRLAELLAQDWERDPSVALPLRRLVTEAPNRELLRAIEMVAHRSRAQAFAARRLFDYLRREGRFGQDEKRLADYQHRASDA